MTGVRVRIDEADFDTLVRALDEPEEVVFAYATHDADNLDVVELDVIGGAEIEFRTRWHVTLADEVRGRVIKAAGDADRCLIEAHSHGPRGFAEFSASDLAGFEEWVPHVRWRLRQRPYAALVVAGDGWDALAWTASSQPSQVAGIDVVHSGTVIRTIEPTHTTITELRRSKRA